MDKRHNHRVQRIRNTEGLLGIQIGLRICRLEHRQAHQPRTAESHNAITQAFTPQQPAGEALLPEAAPFFSKALACRLCGTPLPPRARGTPVRASGPYLSAFFRSGFKQFSSPPGQNGNMSDVIQNMSDIFQIMSDMFLLPRKPRPLLGETVFRIPCLRLPGLPCRFFPHYNGQFPGITMPARHKSRPARRRVGI